MNKILNPPPGPLTDILLNWDRALIRKRQVIWDILDVQSGLKRDRGALVKELQGWIQTPEVERVIQWLKNQK